MSASTHITLWCDGGPADAKCFYWADWGESGIRETRAQARGAGWSYVLGADRVLRDLCPYHAVEGADAPQIPSEQIEQGTWREWARIPEGSPWLVHTRAATPQVDTER
jgi:hypothetical protein